MENDGRKMRDGKFPSTACFSYFSVTLYPFIPFYFTQGHFGDKSFQVIDYTGTDNQNSETQHHIHPKHTRETAKNYPNKTIYYLFIYLISKTWVTCT